MENDRDCGSCAHWDLDASRAGCGWCRARPPAVGADGKTRFPRTRASVDRCAEWKQEEGGRQQEESQADSWERLTEDASKGTYEYWVCEGLNCCDCYAAVDGKKPRERYGCRDCGEAKTIDLLARAKRLAGVTE